MGSRDRVPSDVIILLHGENPLSDQFDVLSLVAVKTHVPILSHLKQEKGHLAIKVMRVP